MREYGLLIERRFQHGSSQVNAYVCAREPERVEQNPLGCGSDGERFISDGVPKHMIGMQLDGLGLYGFISDRGDHSYIGADRVEYRDVYAVDLPKAERSIKTLRRIMARQDRDKAYEPGDRFASLAAALKLTFVCERLSQKVYERTGERWRWLSIAEGRNRFRQLIEEAQAEMREQTQARAAS